MMMPDTIHPFTSQVITVLILVFIIPMFFHTNQHTYLTKKKHMIVICVCVFVCVERQKERARASGTQRETERP